MNLRTLGKTGKKVSEIGLGTWQLGTKWGDPFNREEAFRILEAAEEAGITFIDTADVYNGGKSEETIGEYISAHPDKFYITTKCGRRLNPHTAEQYTPAAIAGFIEDSLQRMKLEKLDMILLHCPPTPVFSRDDIFAELDRQKELGKIADYGVSIEKVEEGIQAMEYDVSAMEVIFNMFRLKPLEQLFPLAAQKNVGIIARVPLASGLLTGKYTLDTAFGPKDHRSYNREGASFDKGETFSGVPYELGLEAVDALKKAFGTVDLAPLAIRWILMHPEVSVVIPGASRASQVNDNVKAAELPPLTDAQMQAVREIYDHYLRETIHPQW
ncbi:MAG: aldo/keto reductase [Clostridia bacterium]|nr:aldo/keto reductase [Clostridia bacterium]MBQ9252178.1 aldo/keto reductase [Clostridia bacterium]